MASIHAHQLSLFPVPIASVVTAEHNREVQRAWQERNRERCAAYSAKYRATHKEELAARRLANLEAVRAHGRERMRQWRAAHPDRVLETGRAGYRRNAATRRAQALARYYRHQAAYQAASRLYNQAHKAQVDARNKQWREANKEHVRLRTIAWVRVNADKIRASAARRKARAWNNGGYFTDDEWRALCTRYDNRCLRCNRTDIPLTADHVIPVSKGGTSWITNIQPLCKPCNSAKSARTWDYR